MRKPAYYRTPLRKRADIIQFLKSRVGCGPRGYHHDHSSIFVWNVKAYKVDFSFDHLLEVYRNRYSDGLHPCFQNPDYIEECRKAYDEADQDYLWQHAQEACWFTVTETDAYNHLWDGTELKVKYAAMGRSSGYIGLIEFNGMNFDEDFSDDWETRFKEMPYNELRKLYSLCVMLNHDFTREVAKDELEYHAAYYVFDGICRDIPQPDARQLELALTD